MSNIDYEDIDKGLREIIRVLNDKGWITAYCCEGHYLEDKNRYSGGFISFFVDFEPKFIPNIDGYSLLEKGKTNISATKQFCDYINFKNKKNKNLANCIVFGGSSSRNQSIEDKNEMHEYFLKELLKWAEDLPIYENRND